MSLSGEVTRPQPGHVPQTEEPRQADMWQTIKAYIDIARPDHWFKNIFVLPGALLAVAFYDQFTVASGINLVLALIGTCLVASANYTINEWLDADFDRFHPIKKHRPSVLGFTQARYVYVQYVILSVVGLAIGWLVSPMVLYTLAFLLVMGVIYNVPPLRSKDRVYLDVVSESINNPIRFMVGWFVVTPPSGMAELPPSSILLAYWMGGAFLMAAKRLSEYRYINNAEQAGLYRRSFQHYTDEKLLMSCVFYALTSAFFFGVFLIKYRIELLLISPFLAILFTWYLSIALMPGSTAQTPEKLYRERKFILFIVALCVLTLALMFIDLPWLNFLVDYTVVG